VSRLPYVLNRLEPGTTVALLLTRPGLGGISTFERQWATALTETAARFGVPLEPIFRANDASLVQIEPAVTPRG
jgi:hypothetical protein